MVKSLGILYCQCRGSDTLQLSMHMMTDASRYHMIYMIDSVMCIIDCAFDLWTTSYGIHMPPHVYIVKDIALYILSVLSLYSILYL